MTFGSQMAIYKQPTPLAFPSETETLKVREMSVDILSVPGTPLMASKQGNTDGAGMDQRSPENTSLLAPAKGGGTWTQKADMPTARKLMGSVVVDGKIYVIGGNAPLATGLVHEYDPATDTWTERADMPTARLGLVAAAVDGIIYAIGGYRHPTGIFNIVEAYNPATDEWTKKGNMLTYRDYMAASVLDGKIYVIGGVWGAEDTPLSDVYEYDPGLVHAVSTVKPERKVLTTWGQVRSAE